MAVFANVPQIKYEGSKSKIPRFSTVISCIKGFFQ